MAMQKKKRIKIEIQNTTMDILINISIKLRHIEISLALFVSLLTIFVSSLNEDTRRTWAELLSWMFRFLVFGDGY